MAYNDFLMREYGYVMLASSGAFILHMWLSTRVHTARQKYNVRYPTMYSEKEPMFNCVQRAHQNALEGIPFYLSLLLTGGLRHPLIASIAGLVYLLGRVLYAVGYSTGNPQKRAPGAIISMVGGMAPLLLCSISAAAGVLGLW